MLAKVVDAFLLLALTVIIHGAGLTIVLRRLPLWKTADDAGFISRTWLLIQLASCAITIHMVEIAMWGYFSGGRNACRILNRRSTSRSSLTPLWNTAISCSRKAGVSSPASKRSWHPYVRLLHRLLLHCRQQVVRFALGPKTELK